MPASRHVGKTKGEDDKHLNVYTSALVIVSSCGIIVETLTLSFVHLRPTFILNCLSC